MTTFRKDCTCGGGVGIMHEPCCGTDEEMPPIERWADACEEAIREVEKVSFEQQGDVAIKQAAKLLSLAVKLHYGEDKPIEIKSSEEPIQYHVDKRELVRRFLLLPFRYQHVIISRLGIFTAHEIDGLEDGELFAKLFKRVSEKGLNEELWKELEPFHDYF